MQAGKLVIADFGKAPKYNLLSVWPSSLGLGYNDFIPH